MIACRNDTVITFHNTTLNAITTYMSHTRGAVGGQAYYYPSESAQDQR